jgi:hypothetical protein
MSDRDELAKDIFMSDNCRSLDPEREWEEFFGKHKEVPTYAHFIADGLLAAGYRKLRTITTTEELDALPVGSVVLVHDRLCTDSCAWQLFDDVRDLRDEYGDKADTAWASPAYVDERASAGLIALGTVTVLHEAVAS